MKPVAVLRHNPAQAPGHLATWLDGAGIPWRLVRVDRGEPVPGDARAFSGLAFMGGPMSVNDDLPWIGPATALVRDAVTRGVPVLGHCLGGQLMAKALGGTVGPAPVKEIGWGRVEIEDTEAGRAWFGASGGFDTFQWHGEAFTLPPGAERVLTGARCPNQAFALGPHLALQCHMEMTLDLVRAWVRGGRGEIRRSLASPGVQPPEEILAGAEARIGALQEMAGRLYARWARGLA